MTIYSAFTGKAMADIEAEFAGKGYGDFKLAVAETVADALVPIQTEYGRILADKAYVDGVLKDGAARASAWPTAWWPRSTARWACCSRSGKHIQTPITG